MRNKRFSICFYISEACKLVEMPSKCVSRMLKRLITTAYKTSSFYCKMTAIKSRSCKIFINWMNLKIFKWIYWSRAVLPDISNNVIKSIILKIVDRTWRKPFFHVYISYFSIFPRKMVLL